MLHRRIARLTQPLLFLLWASCSGETAGMQHDELPTQSAPAGATATASGGTTSRGEAGHESPAPEQAGGGSGGVGGAAAGARAVETAGTSAAAGTRAAEAASAAGKGAAGVSGAAGAAGTAGSAADPATCKRTQADATTPTVYVIGDSTASVYAKDLYPRMGWAQPLQDYFPAGCAKVQDKALSGRSSKSFREEGAWDPIRSALRAGDFVLIQFGHNDEKREDAERYTEPFGTFQEYLGKYIDETLAAKATPILLTPIERNNWSGTKLNSTHGDYPKAMRDLASTRNLTLVDMTQLTHEHFERIGPSETPKLFLHLASGASPNYPSGVTDNTHLQEKGARVVADIAMANLAEQHHPIAALLDHVPAVK